LILLQGQVDTAAADNTWIISHCCTCITSTPWYYCRDR